MKLGVYILLLFLFANILFAQENSGISSHAFPVRNSLTYNQFTINPTLSFVRQQHKYITLKENIGVGIGVFQQQFGVFNVFGGQLNFAYNIRLNQDNNLTFGLNVGAYNNGVNTGNVITTYPDPALDNIPDNSVVSVTPGINFGTQYFDFGLGINNLVLYNTNTSELLNNEVK